MNYEFIGKCLFFPEQGILAVGDLHIGYESMLKQSGVLIPDRQVKDMVKELKNIFLKIENSGKNVSKIVFLGDIKHAFSFEFEERDEFEEVLEFIGGILSPENIIFIKGNHDTIDYSPDKSMKDFYFEDSIAFIHGHRKVKEVLKEKIKIIVMGHLHPCVVLREKKGVKKETYKCFLEGESQGKKVIVMPSFLDFTEGTAINDYGENYIESFSPIPKKDIMKFGVKVIGEKEVLDFGEVKDLN